MSVGRVFTCDAGCGRQESVLNSISHPEGWWQVFLHSHGTKGWVFCSLECLKMWVGEPSPIVDWPQAKSIVEWAES